MQLFSVCVYLCVSFKSDSLRVLINFHETPKLSRSYKNTTNGSWFALSTFILCKTSQQVGLFVSLKATHHTGMLVE